MTRRNRIIFRTAGILIAALLLLVVTAVSILQTSWFAEFVRNRIVASVEESTGGKVELQAFEFDWTRLTARIRNFVLHGTEASSERPLARVALLEIRLKLLSGLTKAVDIRYLGIETPQVNFIVFPDGKTNVPEPRVKAKPSGNDSVLETVVNLAVNQFKIENGSIHFGQRKAAFAAQGENLRAVLNYRPLKPGYEGILSVDPLLLQSGSNKPLSIHVNLPIAIEKDALRITNATIATALSRILINGTLSNLKNPLLSAQLNTTLSVAEMQTGFGLPIDTTRGLSPKTLTAQADVGMSGDQVIRVTRTNIALGKTTFQASGTLDSAHDTAVQFTSNFALPELAALFKLTGTQISGALHANGSARLDQRRNYAVNGQLTSESLGLVSGTTRLSNVSLSSPFHADPFLVSLDGLRLGLLGGSLKAKLFIEKMESLSLEAGLKNFSVPVLTAALTGKHLGFDGTLNGSLQAAGNLHTPGTRGYSGRTRLSVTPGNRGVPLVGLIAARFDGAQDLLSVDKSYLSLPHSRLDVSGSLNRQIDLNLLSRNLNDFLPAINFGAAKPQTTLPIALIEPASMQAQIKGKLIAPQIQSHLGLGRFTAAGRAFDRFALDLHASPTGAYLSNGQLARHGLETAFDASVGLRKWSPLPQSPVVANLTIRNGDVADLLSLAGQSSIVATGSLSSDIHVNGTYGNPLGKAEIRVTRASAYEQPIDHAYLTVDLLDQLVRLTNFEVAAANASLNANGTFRHPRDSFSSGRLDAHVRSTDLQLSKVQPLAQKSPGIAGLIHLTADITGDVQQAGTESHLDVSSVSADLTAHGLRLRNQDVGDIDASARTRGKSVTYKVVSDFAGSDVRVNGETDLVASYPTKAAARINNLSLQKVLMLAGQGDIPARGKLSATADLAGNLQSPDASLDFAFTDGNVYQEPINRLGGRVHYTNTSVEVPALSLDVPAGSIKLHGAYVHPSDNFKTGDLTLVLDSTDMQVAKVEHATAVKPGLDGIIKMAADVAGKVVERNGKPLVLFSRLNANGSANGLHIGQRSLGQASFRTRSEGQQLDFALDSDIARSAIHLSGNSQLAGDYPTRASLSFSNIRYENIAPFLSADNTQAPGVDALVEGKATLNGPVLKSDELTARLQLDRLEARSVPRGSPTGAPPIRTIAFKNNGPVVVALKNSVLNIEHFDIEGPKTSLTASGGLNFKNARSPVSLNIKGNADLGVLQDTNRDFYSSGAIVLDATVRGAIDRPLLNGQIELKKASVNYAESPNGLSNANGVILLNGTSATIQNLTGESGGGRVSVSGFVGYNSNTVNFNLKANASRVRVRTSGVSVTSDADILLIGNSRRSLAGGTITVRKIAYGSSSDAGSFLSTASTPPSTPSAPSPILAGMRLDIRIVTAPDLRVVTTYADRLGIEANLSVRGTAATPGAIGQISVTDGQLVFFGNKYNVNTGTVNFYSPTSIQPIVNFSLETIAQNVSVVLGVSGPIDNLALSYRSDPPLTFQQIVQLLATNTTPNDPTIAARQPAPAQQSLAQMGSSALLSQAVANPLASRVQRVFGLNSFKIDPSVAGANGQPTAKLTLEQKIASNITFTYITDVTQTNAQIIRVEWALSPRLSAVGLRDFNGNVSLQFFYKFKVR